MTEITDEEKKTSLYIHANHHNLLSPITEIDWCRLIDKSKEMTHIKPSPSFDAYREIYRSKTVKVSLECIFGLPIPVICDWRNLYTNRDRFNNIIETICNFSRPLIGIICDYISIVVYTRLRTEPTRNNGRYVFCVDALQYSISDFKQIITKEYNRKITMQIEISYKRPTLDPISVTLVAERL
jgi:hypothetical protein